MNRLIQAFGTPSNKTQLICFPFAGGYSASFRPLHPFLKSSCDMLVAEPPGHGTNPMPLMENLEELVELYLQALIPKLGQPFVLFGHSMVGLIVYRLAQKLEQKGLYPKSVIISAVQPPNIKRTEFSKLENDAFLDYVIGMGAIPPALIKERKFLDYFLPSLRSDFRSLETFEHKDHSLIKSPVHIFNGINDEPCIRNSSDWQRWVKEAHFHTFEGGHMFLFSELNQVANRISSIVNTGNTILEHARL